MRRHTLLPYRQRLSVYFREILLEKNIISSYDDSFSVFFYVCESPSCGLFFSFRLA